jgi:stalled ribosome rescue protein Dom34
MTHHYATVWIDSHEAKIFHVDGAQVDAETLHAPKSHVRRHPSVTAERNHPADAMHFYRDVAHALHSAEEILVVGPAHAKLELVKYVHEHDKALVSKIVGVETVDHPTAAQLLAYTRDYFAQPRKPRAH